MIPRPDRHDVVVVGASAGGVEVLGQLVAGLPADLPAAVFVVVHIRPHHASELAELLSTRGPLHATFALHGEPIVPGRIYLAPPDNHLVVRPGYVDVTRGPKENGHRPAVDTLFRTASKAYGPRVLGVVLSGNQDCGTAGLLSVKARGGIAVVQDPAEAFAAEMPQSAVDHVQIDEIVRAADLGATIGRIVATEPGASPVPVTGALVELEGDVPGAASELVCPACSGKLTVTDVGKFEWFHCHVGHAFSLTSIVSEQAEAVEQALWSAVRALEESAALSRRMAGRGPAELRSRFEEKEATQARQAELLRNALLTGELLLRPEVFPSRDAASPRVTGLKAAAVGSTDDSP
jgi:two-component system, chemotaxis family, protein-glutamate methylesterase/glutaminase